MKDLPGILFSDQKTPEGEDAFRRCIKEERNTYGDSAGKTGS